LAGEDAQVLTSGEPPKDKGRDRRACARCVVDSEASIFLVDVRSLVKGRVLDVSLSGCRIRSNDRFPVGIYRRVEVEFTLDGMPFRLGGVVQSVHDRNTIGIRLLDLSDRKRAQLSMLIEELEEERRREAEKGKENGEQPAKTV
jgi:hypothetical protein